MADLNIIDVIKVQNSMIRLTKDSSLLWLDLFAFLQTIIVVSFDHLHAIDFVLFVIIKLWYLTEGKLKHKQNTLLLHHNCGWKWWLLGFTRWPFSDDWSDTKQHSNEPINISCHIYIQTVKLFSPGSLYIGYWKTCILLDKMIWPYKKFKPDDVRVCMRNEIG